MIAPKRHIPCLIFFIGIILSVTVASIISPINLKNIYQKITAPQEKYFYLENHPLVESARKQIGIVTKYDSNYYEGGYPPPDRGVCTDVIAQALLANGYDLKKRLDQDMLSYPNRYPTQYDPNINFRRVRNIKIFFDCYAQILPICTTEECFSKGLWQPGDLVTFDKSPGGLWHIAIISNRYKIISLKEKIGVPLLIHNEGRGVRESNRLLNWPAPITGHYRIPLNQLSHENLFNFLLSMHIGT